MRTVVCRIDKTEVPDKMAQIRRWLDQRQNPEATFVYQSSGSDVIVAEISFVDEREADDFAATEKQRRETAVRPRTR